MWNVIIGIVIVELVVLNGVSTTSEIISYSDCSCRSSPPSRCNCWGMNSEYDRVIIELIKMDECTESRYFPTENVHLCKAISISSPSNYTAYLINCTLSPTYYCQSARFVHSFAITQGLIHTTQDIQHIRVHSTAQIIHLNNNLTLSCMPVWDDWGWWTFTTNYYCLGIGTGVQQNLIANCYVNGWKFWGPTTFNCVTYFLLNMLN